MLGYASEPPDSAEAYMSPPVRVDQVKLDLVRLQFAVGILQDAIRNVRNLPVTRPADKKNVEFTAGQLDRVSTYLTFSLEYSFDKTSKIRRMARNL